MGVHSQERNSLHPRIPEPVKTLIIAPHVDDETIGCFSILRDRRNRQTTVLWCHDLDMGRLTEGYAAANRLGFHATTYKGIVLEKWDEVYVPRRDDNHPDHKRVCAEFRKYATHFYSVDMIEASPLPSNVADIKRHTLNTCYPSQAALWERDHKYWLFERIETTDFDVYSIVRIGKFQITCLAKYANAVNRCVCNRNGFSDEHFSEILAVCPTGKVTLTADGLNLILEAS